MSLRPSAPTRSLVLLLACLGAACGTSAAQKGSQPVLSGDRCALFHDPSSCQADGADGCRWYALLRPCIVYPDGGMPPCEAGSCQGPAALDGGGGSDGGTVRAACGCPLGGVCVERSAGQVTCEAQPTACTAADACTCFVHGTTACTTDLHVAALCNCL